MRAILLGISLLWASAYAPRAMAQSVPKLGILPFAAKRINPDTVSILDDLLVHSVDQTHRYDIITASDINAMLGLEKMKDMLSCTSTVCIAELGGALGVDTLLAGSVSVLGDELIVSLTLIDIRKQHVQAREQVRVANQEGLYAGAIDQAVQALFRPAASSPEAPAAPGPPPHAAAPEAAPAAQVAGPAQAILHFTSENEEPLGVFVRMLDGDERHCPSGVTRTNPCTLELPPGRVMVLSKGGAARNTIRLPPGHTEYKLHVGASRTGIITGSSIAGAGAVALIAGGVTLHQCNGPDCFNGGSLAALITGGVAVYGGLVTLFFACIMDFDNSQVTGPDEKPLKSGLPILVPTLTPGGVFNSLMWQF